MIKHICERCKKATEVNNAESVLLKDSLCEACKQEYNSKLEKAQEKYDINIERIEKEYYPTEEVIKEPVPEMYSWEAKPDGGERLVFTSEYLAYKERQA